MSMIHSIKPYGFVSISEVRKIASIGDRYFMIDDYGWWQIEESEYKSLEKRGIEVYGREEHHQQF